MSDKFWLDETDPAQLRRRADDQWREGHYGLYRQLRERADEIAEKQLWPDIPDKPEPKQEEQSW